MKHHILLVLLFSAPLMAMDDQGCDIDHGYLSDTENSLNAEHKKLYCLANKSDAVNVLLVKAISNITTELQQIDKDKSYRPLYVGLPALTEQLTRRTNGVELLLKEVSLNKFKKTTAYMRIHTTMGHVETAFADFQLQEMAIHHPIRQLHESCYSLALLIKPEEIRPSTPEAKNLPFFNHLN